jgi:hypothetical protein
LIIAAIAIPNILRSKMAANEASAVGSLRTYNTALVSYATECPSQGYPASLTFLGPSAAGADKCCARRSGGGPHGQRDARKKWLPFLLRCGELRRERPRGEVCAGSRSSHAGYDGNAPLFHR